MHYIYRKELTLTIHHVRRQFRGVAPEPPARLSIFTFKEETSFPPEFENLRALIPVCYHGCEKVWTNWKTPTDLAWFTNSVLATSPSRRDE